MLAGDTYIYKSKSAIDGIAHDRSGELPCMDTSSQEMALAYAFVYSCSEVRSSTNRCAPCKSGTCSIYLRARHRYSSLGLRLNRRFLCFFNQYVDISRMGMIPPFERETCRKSVERCITPSSIGTSAQPSAKGPSPVVVADCCCMLPTFSKFQLVWGSF